MTNHLKALTFKTSLLHHRKSSVFQLKGILTIGALILFLYLKKKTDKISVKQEISIILSKPPRIPFTCDKNIGNSLIRNVLEKNNQPETFKCACVRSKTCAFIYNVKQITEPQRLFKITNHFTCTFANVIYCTLEIIA